MAKTKPASSNSFDRLALRHALIGWAGLLIFLTLGILLEILHGLKLDLYLDVRQETRRFMWTLAHAHGALFSLVHLAFAWSLTFSSRWMNVPGAGFRSASWAFTGGLILMPLGFLLGGIWTYGGDPGMGIFLVPVGALLMLFGCVRVLALLASFRNMAAK
jgi:uncharacterized membrane protein (DUF485 family)